MMRTLALKGHSGGVTVVAWSHCSAQLVSGSRDCTLRVWEAKSGECKEVLYGHTDSVDCVAWSPNSQWIASGSRDQTVRSWTNHPWERNHLFKGHSAPVTSITWLDTARVLSGSEDCTMRLWDVRGEGSALEAVATPHHSGFVNIGHCYNKGIISVHVNNTLRVWTGWDHCEVFDTEAVGELRRAAVSPDCAHVATLQWQPAQAAGQRTLQCCDARGQPSVAFSDAVKAMASLVDCLAWSADGKKIVLGTCDGWVLVCDAVTGTLERRIDNRLPTYVFGPAVSSVALSPNSMRVAAALNSTIHVRHLCAWSDKRNKEFDPETRRIVFCLMCVRNRLQSMPACLPVMPVLPMEMWLEVFAMLPV